MLENENSLNFRIKILINESEYLLRENVISERQFENFKTQVNAALKDVIKSDLNNDIKKNAFRALKPYTGKIKFDFFPVNWIYKLILAKVAWDNDMVFLLGKKKSDRYKSQIPKIKMQLEAIDFKINKLKT